MPPHLRKVSQILRHTRVSWHETNIMILLNKRILAIAVNTFRQSLRDRILFVAVGFAIFFIAFSLFIGSISLDQDVRIMQNLGLTVIFLLQMFVAVFVSATLIYTEVERRTFFMILPKPLHRSEVLLGKFIGLALLNALVTLLAGIVYAAVVYSKAGFAFPLAGSLLAIGFGFAEALIVTLLGILFSALTSPILAVFYLVAVCVIGHSSSLLLAVIVKQGQPIVKYALYGLYYVFPSFEKFSIRDQAVYGALPSAEHVLFTMLYAVAYGWCVFIIARLIFDRRQF